MNDENKIKYQLILDCNNQLKQMGILRFEILAIVSSISMAIFGFIFTLTNIIQNSILAGMSLSIFLFITLVSLAIYIDQTRENMYYLINVMQEMKIKKLGQDFDTPKPKSSAHWPETLYIIFIIDILFFILSLLKF
ncbi:hypothetical protein KKC83_03030 [Patescibacteria group bacterium]|nr:hypothetical protein [Candidatus Falkowbacteria bacterium]MBU3905715.1 hypothetical protein [Patescibacteria group bacterium]MBU4014954.1 hypothetical protein [Patescibacteria group bacterium]MBU4026489.1 hypothetical protein [Patescibacteria group bacterium]MBU4072702.1 hypothetical protein [Patescibacteria group bacterium]